jgi:hypothetical protein
MASKRTSQWLGIILILLVSVGYTWATWRYFTKPIPGGNDFLTHYAAWEAYFKLGVSPYSEDAALFTQQAIYGRPALPGEDQNRMVYPFYSILIHGPFVFLDYPLARAIYMTFLQAALFLGVIMALDLFKWSPATWLSALLLIWSLLFYPEARGVILGQFAIFGFFSLIASLYFYKQGRDSLSGMILVLSTVKPTLVFLIVPLLLIYAATRRRWRFIVSFMGTLALVTFGSLIISPNWISDWIFRITRYSGYTVGQSPVWLLTHVDMPALGGVGEAIIDLFLFLGMLFTWWRAIRGDDIAEFYWALGITLVVSNLIVPRSATTNYVLMLIPTLWIFSLIDRRLRWGELILVATMLVSFIGLWWLHFATVVGNQEQAIMFIPYPLVLGAFLLVGRKWLLKDTASQIS